MPEVEVGAVFARIGQLFSFQRKRRESARKHDSFDNDGSFLHTSIGPCRPGLYPAPEIERVGVRLDRRGNCTVALPDSMIDESKICQHSLNGSRINAV